MKYFIKIILIICFFLMLVFTYSLYNGYIWLNKPNLNKFQMMGIDVSAYQEDIEWIKVRNDGIKFVYIKATEGKEFKDNKFIVNWENAKKVGIKRGAYHFFSFVSSGIDQAENFINVVPSEDNCLPPVVDIEFGGNSSKIPNKVELQKELRDFICQIEYKYKQKPILYVTYDSYEKYIIGDFENYTIWIRDIIKYPHIKDNREWVFWQYNNRGRVKGINTFVDLNVFNGNELDFEKLLMKNNRQGDILQCFKNLDAVPMGE